MLWDWRQAGVGVGVWDWCQVGSVGVWGCWTVCVGVWEIMLCVFVCGCGVVGGFRVKGDSGSVGGCV